MLIICIDAAVVSDDIVAVVVAISDVDIVGTVVARVTYFVTIVITVVVAGVGVVWTAHPRVVDFICIACPSSHAHRGMVPLGQKWTAGSHRQTDK